MRECKNCKYYKEGVNDQQRHEWEWSNFGRHADGVCSLYFPRGYIGRKPPHPAIASGSCFQWEEKSGQIELDEDGQEVPKWYQKKQEEPHNK